MDEYVAIEKRVYTNCLLYPYEFPYTQVMQPRRDIDTIPTFTLTLLALSYTIEFLTLLRCNKKQNVRCTTIDICIE